MAKKNKKPSHKIRKKDLEILLLKLLILEQALDDTDELIKIIKRILER